jgi:hypothetical protein
MASFTISEFDVFFLSYDEPNAERHWSDLVDKAPWAKRVHGVTGFDAAHRACAEQSETDWFVTVDADNIVDPSFFECTIEFDPDNTPNRCFSWNGVNAVNGLMYGNGGLKLWSKAFVLTMNSHENATDSRKAVDFCWEDNYFQIAEPYSFVWPNGSPYQAFRAGYREGIKLTLLRGERVHPESMMKALPETCLRNARIWASVGSDIENGLWAMLGTRYGWANMCDLNWDYTVIRDYGRFKEHWAGIEDLMGGPDVVKTMDRSSHRQKLVDEVILAGEVVTRATKIPLPVLDPATSEFFRSSYRLRNE